MPGSRSLLEQLRQPWPRARLVDRSEVDAMPKAWSGVFHADRLRRVRAALALWKPFADVLPIFARGLADGLRDVACVRHARAFHLVYEVNVAGELLLYRGGRPRARLPRTWTRVHAEAWRSIDARIREFYTTVHDGFGWLPSGYMGLTPLDDVGLDIVVAPSGPAAAMILLDSGTGAQLAAGPNTTGAPDGFVASPGKVSEVEGDLWRLLDTWMAIGLAGEGTWTPSRRKPRKRAARARKR